MGWKSPYILARILRNTSIHFIWLKPPRRAGFGHYSSPIKELSYRGRQEYLQKVMRVAYAYIMVSTVREKSPSVEHG